MLRRNRSIVIPQAAFPTIQTIVGLDFPNRQEGQAGLAGPAAGSLAGHGALAFVGVRGAFRFGGRHRSEEPPIGH